MWFLLAIIGYFLLAIVVVLDKLILTREVPKPIIYTFYSTIFMLGAFVLYPFGGEMLSPAHLSVALISGLGFGFALMTLFQALKSGEATHIHPFNGGIVAIATYLLGQLFLNEFFTLWQGIGIATLIVATIILSIEKSQYQRIHIGFFWAALSGIFFAVSHVSAKYLYDLYPFLNIFIWTKGLTGLVGLLLLFSPTVWKSFFEKKKKKNENRHPITITIVDKSIGVVGVILIQYAIAEGSVTVVNALAGIQFIFVFAIVYFLTHSFPKVLKEYFTRREVQLQMISLLLLLVGVGLLVVQY